MSSLKERLKNLRLSRGLNQEQLAKELGLSRSTIAGYETGKRTPDYDIMLKIADYFGVTTDYLLGHEIEKQNETAHKRIIDAVSDNPELLQFWEQLSQRDDLQLLFKQTKDLSPASIKRIIEIIKIIEDEEQRNQ